MDDKEQIRIRLEAEAVIALLSLIEEEKLEIMSSAVLEFELSRTPDVVRREYGIQFLKLATDYIQLNQAIEKRAKHLEQFGVKALDALHLASAESAGAEYFCTCDDKLLKKIQQIKDVKILAGTPLDLLRKLKL